LVRAARTTRSLLVRDELRLYDLASGTAWIASSCSGVSLRGSGSVDGPATDATRQLTVRTGTLSVDNLREAALLAFLRPSVTHSHRLLTTTARLPADIAPRAIHHVGHAGYGFGSSWGSSAQTRISFAWIDNGAIRVTGQTTWPDSAEAIEDHFDDLLRIAEGGLREGCAPAALPASLPTSSGAPGVPAIDASAASFARANDALWTALDGARNRACRESARTQRR
jgi:hypothetical protein